MLAERELGLGQDASPENVAETILREYEVWRDPAFEPKSPTGKSVRMSWSFLARRDRQEKAIREWSDTASVFFEWVVQAPPNEWQRPLWGAEWPEALREPAHWKYTVMRGKKMRYPEAAFIEAAKLHGKLYPEGEK